MTQGTGLPERLDTRLVASLYPGRARERLKDAKDQLFAPLFDAMAEHGVEREELHEYLHTRHAEERNCQIRAIDPNNNSGTGMTDAEAQAILARVSADPQRQAALDAIATRVHDVLAGNRYGWERLEDPKTLMAGQQRYSHYVPLKASEPAEDEHGTPEYGQAFSRRDLASLGALGCFDRAGDILTNVIDQAMKNRVAKTFLRFVTANPSAHYKFGLAETCRRINPQTEFVETVWVTGDARTEEVFAAKIGGKTY